MNNFNLLSPTPFVKLMQKISGLVVKNKEPGLWILTLQLNWSFGDPEVG